jgi:hypothetical protein
LRDSRRHNLANLMKQKSPTGIRLNTMLDPRHRKRTAIRAEVIADETLAAIANGNYPLGGNRLVELVRSDPDTIWLVARLAACAGLRKGKELA